MHGYMNVKKKIQYLIFAKFSKDLLATIMLWFLTYILLMRWTQFSIQKKSY